MARIIGTPYQSSGICGAHFDSDWQVATDNTFTNILIESLDDQTNLEEITLNINTLDVPLYFRARYKSNTCSSAWSNVVEKTIFSSNLIPFVLTPSLTIDIVRNLNGVSDRHEVLEINLTASPFTIDNGTGNHLDTTWVIEDLDGNILWESLNDTVNLEAITISNPSWFKLETLYRFKVFYRSDVTDQSGNPIDSQWRIIDYSLDIAFEEELKTIIPPSAIPSGLYQPQQKLEDMVLISIEESVLNPNNVLYIVPVYLQPDPANPTPYDGLNIEVYKSDVTSFVLTNLGIFNVQSLFTDPTIELRVFTGTKISVSDNNGINEDTISILIDSHVQNSNTRKIKGFKLTVDSTDIIDLVENSGNEINYSNYNVFDILKNQATDFDNGTIGLRINEFYYVYTAIPSVADPSILEDNFMPLNPKITYDITDTLWVEDLRGSGIALGENGDYLSVAGFTPNNPDNTVNIYSNDIFSSSTAGSDKWHTKEIINFSNAWAATGSIRFDSGKTVIFYNTYKAPYSGDPFTDVVTTGKIILSNESMMIDDSIFNANTFINRKFVKLLDGTVLSYGGYYYTFDGINETVNPNKLIIRLF